MKIIAAVFLLIAFLSACSTTYIPYHSMASIQHFTIENRTKLMLVLDDNGETADYAVCAAQDLKNGDKDIYYLLVVPNTSGSSGSIENIVINYGVVLTPENAFKFIAGLDLVIEHWNDNVFDNIGYFYEFMSAPEQEIKQISENVLEWNPSLDFRFQITKSGPLGNLFLGRSTLVYHYQFDEVEKIQKLKYYLEKGMSQLGELGYSAE